MNKITSLCWLHGWLAATLVVGIGLPAAAQSSGSRGGVSAGQGAPVPLKLLDPEVAVRYITIEGHAEVRVPPTEIRVVMAITHEAATAGQCQQAIAARIKAVRTRWTALGIKKAAVVEDFIAVLPKYSWTLERRDDVEVGVEERSGYRMQTNLHLAVADEALAQRALAAAFDLDVTDIIAFDYWHDSLHKLKATARKRALQSAREKADVLLAAPRFASRPPVINVQERTDVVYPSSMYESFTNVDDQAVVPSWRREVTLLRAHRPKNTYYRGFRGNGDFRGQPLPMKPELSVVSTVRLYYRSPGLNKPAAPTPMP